LQELLVFLRPLLQFLTAVFRGMLEAVQYLTLHEQSHVAGKSKICPPPPVIICLRFQILISLASTVFCTSNEAMLTILIDCLALELTFFGIFCRRSAGAELCLNARSLIRSFTCKSTYNLSVWSWGPPRDVIVKPKAEKTLRAVTPFNNLIGGLILTQVRRKASVCPVDPPPQTKALVNTFGCQVPWEYLNTLSLLSMHNTSTVRGICHNQYT
jgi:hypothetical protein